MSSKHIRGDFNFAYPTAEIAVMGADGAVNILFRREVSEARDSDEKRAELVADYVEKFSNPFKAAELGYIDEVIQFKDTRRRVVQAFEVLKTKVRTNPARKHGNIPL